MGGSRRRRARETARGLCGVLSVWGSLSLLTAGLLGCGAGVVAGEKAPIPVDHSVGSASIRGTALDARTGRPVEGAWIELADGTRTATDADGHFRLGGLPVGTEGELVAHTTGDLVGRNRLRPLDPGELEVVVFLRPKPEGVEGR